MHLLPYLKHSDKTFITMDNVIYHLHIDAARMPENLLAWATEEAGFHCDDFPHSFYIGDEIFPARHLTKYIYDPNPLEVKRLCHMIKAKADDYDLQGLIQAEFIMDEKNWGGKKTILGDIPAPFQIKMRHLDQLKGENFKKHEIHLECEKSQTSDAIINTLSQCGFHLLDTERFVTFTCSGHPKELNLIKKMIIDFLDIYQDSVKGTLVHEATAFWSLHGMESEHLPEIVDSVH